MGKRSHQWESELESDMQKDELCLLTGEMASLYVDDTTTASLINGYFCFFFCFLLAGPPCLNIKGAD